MAFHAFQQKITNPIQFKLFMLTQLPSAWLAGLRLQSLDSNTAKVIVRQKWFNKNPFRSIYFAILSMAAEVSTGVLAMGHLYQRQPAVSMLVVESTGKFYKKATGQIVFTCAEGHLLQQAIETAISTQEGTQHKCHTIGTNEQGEVVAEFWFTWSFKARRV